MMDEKTCCFTGHSTIPSPELPIITKRLEYVIGRLIGQDVVNYLCGGAVGFDMLAGYTVLDFKEKYEAVKLIMVLPRRNQDARRSEENKAAYQSLLAAADKIIYFSEWYMDGCKKKRNSYLVENSDYCIAYLKHARSGTGQTVRLAEARGLTVFNLAYHESLYMLNKMMSSK